MNSIIEYLGSEMAFFWTRFPHLAQDVLKDLGGGCFALPMKRRWGGDSHRNYIIGP